MPDTIPPVDDKIVTEPGKVESLRSAIASAVKETSVTTEETPETKPAKTKTEEKPKETSASDLTEEQQKAAINIYKALANPDPKIQRSAFELLAKAANLEVKDIETKKDIVEAKKDLTSLLKEGLGEFDFLADKLGPILDKVLKDYVVENTKDVRAKVELSERARVEAQVNDAIETVFSAYTLDDKERATLVKEMEVLMDNFVPSAKTSHQQYFKSLIILAAENKGINLKSTNTKGIVDKITKNRNDAGTRLASARGAEVKDVVRITGFKNLREAVKDAMEKSQTERK